MHPTAAFRNNDPDLRAAMIANVGFGMIFLQTPEGPRVAHTPLHLGENARLQFHLARTNSIAKHLDGARALAVVNGPDAYISARWYEAHNQVPTWNYIAFEMEGMVEARDPELMPGLLETLSAHHEAKVRGGTPWTMDKMDEKPLQALLRGIVGFEMRVDAVRETVKLSQNKPAEERERIATGLEDQGEAEMARLMRVVAS